MIQPPTAAASKAQQSMWCKLCTLLMYEHRSAASAQGISCRAGRCCRCWALGTDTMPLLSPAAALAGDSSSSLSSLSSAAH